MKKSTVGALLFLTLCPALALAKGSHPVKARPKKGKAPIPVQGEFAGDIQPKDVEINLETSGRKVKGSKGKTK